MTANAITVHASDHPLKSVTIFHSNTSAAEIVRTFPVSLRAEKNVVNIDGISSCIHIDSPRIHVLKGPRHVRIFDICCDTEQVAAKRDALVAKRTLRQQEYDRLVDTAARLHISHTPARPHTVNVHVHGLAKDSESMDSLDLPSSKATREVDELIRTLILHMRIASDAIQTLDRQILELEHQLAVPRELRKGDGSTVITATVLAEQECEVTLQLTYLVCGARWEPHYDLQAQTAADGRPSPNVTLHQYARITQSTGEDWKDTKITLSTSSSQILPSLDVPTLEPVHVSRIRASLPQARLLSTAHMSPLARAHSLTVTPGGFHLHAAGSTSSNAHQGPQPNQAAQGAEDTYVHVPHPDPTSHIATTQSQTQTNAHHAAVHPVDLSSAHAHSSTHSPVQPPAFVYCVGGGEAVSLSSDGLAHTIALTTLQLCAELQYLCVPQKSPTVFMQARLKNSSEHALLAGPVSVFVDDKFVARTSLSHIGMDETFECILGVDTGIKVLYHQRSQSEPPHNPAGTTKSTTYTGIITLTNRHDFDIARLILRNSVPLGNESEKVLVTLRKPDGLAEAKDGQEVTVFTDANPDNKTKTSVRWANIENGIYEWVCGIRAGAEVTLEAEWVVTAPGSVRMN